MTELVPINQHVLIDISEEETEQRTPSGIIIPETAREKNNFGKVTSLSNIDNAEIAVGDTILYKAFSGTEVKHGNKKYLLVPYADVLAKIVHTEEI